VRRTFAIVGLSLLALLLTGAPARSAPPGSRALKVCQGCHDVAPNPKLEGQSRSYLTRQIQSFLRKERAASIDGKSCSIEDLRRMMPADFLAVLNYYSTAKATPEVTAHPTALGEHLFQEGRLQSGIQACAACHGRDGGGGVQTGLDSAAVAPRVAWQREGYIVSQLRSFRKGSRHNDYAGIMQRMVTDLTDAEYVSLAAYLTSLDPAGIPPLSDEAARHPMPEKAALCQVCHGVNGESVAEAFPKIGGLPAGQIAKQLHDVQTGARVIDVMAPIAGALSETEIKDISTYFAQFGMHQGPYDPLKAARGEKLFLEGNTSTGGYPACLYCHGIDGRGIANVDWAPGDIPRLAGQHPGYIRKALKDFRSGARTNDHAELMRLVAVRMTDREIDDVSHYAYSLGEKRPPNPETGGGP
jgi:cytochrome c553